MYLTSSFSLCYRQVVQACFRFLLYRINKNLGHAGIDMHAKIEKTAKVTRLFYLKCYILLPNISKLNKIN